MKYLMLTVVNNTKVGVPLPDRFMFVGWLPPE